MEENIEYLRRLGMTEYQSKALIALFTREEATAYEISKLVQIPLTKIYQVLKSLEDREFVDYTLGKPRKYRSKEAVELIELLIGKKENLLIKLRDESKEQLKLMNSLELVEQLEPEKIHPILSTEKYL